MIGTIGGAIMVEKDREFAIKNVALIKPLANSVVSMSYILHYLNSDYINNLFEASASGATQKFISLGFIRNLEVRLPTIEEQERIVASLESERVLIDANKKLIELYTEKIKNKISEIWGE
jgi:restriction endonuclease S subunit